MSQILIISDSHFLRKVELEQFIKSLPPVQAIIHCGDIYIGYKNGDFQNFYICKGNNDFGDIQRVLNFTIDD
ncbi:MAG: metallophosphoesterase, partial [Coprobacillus sp.]